MTKNKPYPEWDCVDDCLDAAKKIAPIFAKMILSEFQHHSGEEDPKDAILKIISDVVQTNVRQAVSEGIKEAFETIEIFPTTEDAKIALRLEPTGWNDDPLVRRISLDDIREQFAAHDPDNAEELTSALADRLEELASELRNGKGAFGWRTL